MTERDASDIKVNIFLVKLLKVTKQQTFKTLKTYGKGNRVGFLGPDLTSTRQDTNYYKGIFGFLIQF